MNTPGFKPLAAALALVVVAASAAWVPSCTR